MFNYPSIPDPTSEVESLRASVAALKQVVEVLIGVRGDTKLRAFTYGEAVAQLLPYRPPMFFKADLPAASAHPRTVLYLFDPTANKHLIFSDGAVWRYADGTAV